MRFSRDRAYKLLQRLTENPTSPRAGVLANDLLGEFHRGCPLEYLRPMLRSGNDEVVTLGVWIASELGEKGKPLLGDVFVLLKHPAKKVRFSAIDCILVWASPSESSALVSVVGLLEDPEAGVRWKAMDFVSRASREQLESALAYLVAINPKSSHVLGLRWLLGPQSHIPAEVMRITDGEDPVLRKYGAIAAARISQESTQALFHASGVPDPDVRDFAQASISLL